MKTITRPLELIHLLCSKVAYVPDWSTPSEIDPKAKPLFLYELLKYMAPRPCFDFTFVQDGSEVLITPKYKPAASLRVVLSN